MRRKSKTPQGVKYPEAVTADGQLVRAIEIGINSNDWKGHKFYIPMCEGKREEEMQFVKRKQNGRNSFTFFFRHKAKNKEERKEYDNYLHNLAEKKFIERFNKGLETGEFYVYYILRSECPRYKTCKYKEILNCNIEPRLVTTKINLCKEYDTCTREGGIGEFVADLLLTNSKDDTIKPLLIEIFVTHECSDKKKNSGYRIIEIKIEKAEDTDNEIVENSSEDIDELGFMSIENAPKTPPIKFYGFNKKAKLSNLPKFGNFTLIEEGGKFCGSCRLLECNKVDNEISENTAISISFPLDELKDIDLYELGMAFAYKHGVPLRDCSLCAKYKIPYGNTDRYDARSCRLLDATYHQNEPNRDEIKIKDPYVFQLPYKCEGFDKSKMARNCRGFIFDTKRIDELNKVIRKLHGVTIIL